MCEESEESRARRREAVGSVSSGAGKPFKVLFQGKGSGHLEALTSTLSVTGPGGALWLMPLMESNSTESRQQPTGK